MPANSSLFKPSVTQPISQTPYDLNNELLVRYSGHGLNNKLLVRYSGHGLNNEPFDEPTVLDHSNTELVRFSDLHCSKLNVNVEHSNSCFLGSEKFKECNYLKIKGKM